ncbi:MULTISPECIES: hypothetical protein [unclassified Streptomyces]|nr:MULTISPECIES: hypothetical protein [unclassified Streptomyces]
MKTLGRAVVALALAAGGVMATGGTANAYATWDCKHRVQKTKSAKGDQVILNIYRCPDGHDYARGIISGARNARNARVWLDDSIDGGRTWKARQYTKTSSRSTQTPQRNLLFDGSPHKVRACGDTSGHRPICTVWY